MEVPLDARTDALSTIDQLHRAANEPVRVHELAERLETLIRSYLAPVVADQPIADRLTRTENRMLTRLMQTPGQICSNKALMDAMYWDRNVPAEAPIISVMVCHLRKKLKGTTWAIQNIWGSGYKLVEAEQ